MTDPTPAVLDTRRRRLLYRATHCGTRENDLLIGRFVSQRIAGFTEAELQELEALLDMPDPDLADFLTGRRTIPAESDSPMLRRIKDAVG
ncbi:MAG: succinate dehydrogenase assembly factor 2 [Acetobacteraceae bacterium]